MNYISNSMIGLVWGLGAEGDSRHGEGPGKSKIKCWEPDSSFGIAEFTARLALLTPVPLLSYCCPKSPRSGSAGPQREELGSGGRSKEEAAPSVVLLQPHLPCTCICTAEDRVSCSECFPRLFLDATRPKAVFLLEKCALWRPSAWEDAPFPPRRRRRGKRRPWAPQAPRAPSPPGPQLPLPTSALKHRDAEETPTGREDRGKWRAGEEGTG